MPTYPNISATNQVNLVEGGQEGHPALLEENGVFTVKDAEGHVQFQGNEVAAEFAYWRSLLGVPPDESEVVL